MVSPILILSILERCIMSQNVLGDYKIVAKYMCENGWTQGIKYYVFIQERRQVFWPLFVLKLFSVLIYRYVYDGLFFIFHLLLVAINRYLVPTASHCSSAADDQAHGFLEFSVRHAWEPISRIGWKDKKTHNFTKKIKEKGNIVTEVRVRERF